MKFSNLINCFISGDPYGLKILFCFVLPLFLGVSCAPSEKPLEKPYEMMWWKDLHVKAKPIKDKNNAVFAIWVALTNRSLTDTAILKRTKVLEQSLFLSIYSPAPDKSPESPMLRTIELEIDPKEMSLVSDGTFSPKAPVIIEIAPGHHMGFCLKLEDYILPNQIIESDREASLVLYVQTSLAWRRSTGVVTLFGVEKDADYRVIPRIEPPRFDFGAQKITINKNLACEDAGK